jgi:DNA polymerase III alpha subunit
MDIDIDFGDREIALSVIKYVNAMRLNEQNKSVKHATGIYLQEIPKDIINNISTIPFKEAENHGWMKLDFLNVGFYKQIKDRNHLKQLINKEPDWTLLQNKELLEYIFHLNGHYKIVSKLKPSNIDQLAATLAIIRPAKAHLLNKDWDTILKNVWLPTPSPDGAYAFKKSHSYSYATVIIAQLNLMEEALNNFD